jgi:endonuclease/exonuclease/phosphatase family metal-dependent hydrolase
LVLALVGCSSDETEEQEPPPPGRVKAVTYNLGLALGFVDAAVERAPFTIPAAVAVDADVLCVQEVWTAADVQSLTSAAAATLPNTRFLDPQPDTDPGQPACGASDQASLTTLRTCVDTSCADICTDQLVNCVLGECGLELAAVPGTCQTCLQANVGKPIDDILSTCNASSEAYTYGGAFGIGLLTHLPLSGADELVLQSTTTRRAVIYAELDTPLGPVHSFCTHLTAGLSSVEYQGPYGSWEEEQAAQLDELIAWVDQKAGADAQVLVMGDLNTGPAGENYIAEVSGNYDKVVAAGLSNPYLAGPAEPCTFCRTNPLVDGAADESESVVIDHVLLRNGPANAWAERVLDEDLGLPDYCGGPATLKHSDHYGVRAHLP